MKRLYSEHGREARADCPRFLATVAILAMVAAAAATGCSSTDPVSTNGGGSIIKVSPDSVSLPIGGSVTLTAAMQAGSGAGSSATFFWSSSDTNVAVVSQAGVVTGRATGSAQVAASAQGVSGVASVAVVQQSVAGIVIVPAAATLRVNSTLQLSDTLKDSAGAVLGGRTTTWSTDNATVATVDAAGLVIARSVGAAHISAASGGKSASAVITVTLVPVASISVQPRMPTVVAGQTTQLTATPLDSAGDPLGGVTISWRSLETGLATVSSAGLVTGVAAGTAVIQAISGTTTGTDTVLVVPAPVAAVVLSPSTSVLLVGQAEQLSVQVTDANGQPVKNPSVKFSTSNATIATVSNKGLVTGTGPGTATISGTSQGKTGQATVQVLLVPVASVVVTPAADTLAPGQRATLHAAVLDSVGDPLPGRVVVWSSSNTAVATIDQRGRVTAVAPGTVVMSAASGGKSGEAAVTVTNAPVALVVVTPAVDTLQAGQQQQLTATLTDANGNVLNGRVVTWSSGNPGIAVVDGTGLVTGVFPGDVTITATAESVQGFASVVVIILGGGP